MPDSKDRRLRTEDGRLAPAPCAGGVVQASGVRALGTEGGRRTPSPCTGVEPQSAAPAPRSPDQARVFFALWPDNPVRAALDRLAGALHRLRGGRRTRAETLHLTLVFVGNLPREHLLALQAVAAGVRVPAFTLTLDRTDCWPHNRIAHATASQPPHALLDLVCALERGLDGLGIPFDHRPYKAHVTLLRKTDCRRADPPIEPIVWPARDFVLVESELGTEGARYLILGRYPLITADQR